MVKLTKNIHKMVQKRPKSSFLRGGSPYFCLIQGGPCFDPEIQRGLDCCCKLKGGACPFKNFQGFRVLRIAFRIEDFSILALTLTLFGRFKKFYYYYFLLFVCLFLNALYPVCSSPSQYECERVKNLFVLKSGMIPPYFIFYFSLLGTHRNQIGGENYCL